MSVVRLTALLARAVVLEDEAACSLYKGGFRTLHHNLLESDRGIHLIDALPLSGNNQILHLEHV